MKIIAFGDVHMDLGRYNSIPGIKEADLVIITGDITNFGHKSDAGLIIKEIKSANDRVLALAGNLDESDVDDYLTTIGINLHGRGETVENGIGIFGLGGSNPTPFNTPNEFSEDEMATLLEKGFEKARDATLTILVSHTPPLNTKTDLLPSGVHVGSKAVRAFIENNQPDLCLTGHIHESRAEDYISKTHILNPGMIKDGGWIEVVIEKGKVQAAIKLFS